MPLFKKENFQKFPGTNYPQELYDLGIYEYKNGSLGGGKISQEEIDRFFKSKKEKETFADSLKEHDKKTENMKTKTIEDAQAGVSYFQKIWDYLFKDDPILKWVKEKFSDWF